jgi:hypothetical protein
MRCGAINEERSDIRLANLLYCRLEQLKPAAEQFRRELKG